MNLKYLVLVLVIVAVVAIPSPSVAHPNRMLLQHQNPPLISKKPPRALKPVPSLQPPKRKPPKPTT